MKKHMKGKQVITGISYTRHGGGGAGGKCDNRTIVELWSDDDQLASFTVGELLILKAQRDEAVEALRLIDSMEIHRMASCANGGKFNSDCVKCQARAALAKIGGGE